MNSYYLSSKDYKYVSDGWRSISGHSNIQPFLEKNFLFRKAYCKMKMYYSPLFKILVSALYPFRKTKIIPLKIKHILTQEELSRLS